MEPSRPAHPLGRALTALALAALAGCGDGPTATVAPPSLPSGLQATAATHTEVSLTWSAAAGTTPVTQFRIERALGTGAFVQVAAVAGDVLVYRDTGLTPATSYSYRVRACGEGGCSAFATATVTTLDLLLITTVSLKPGVVGQAYNGGINATGGSGGYLWVVESGSLPAGLHLSEEGILSGIPATSQTQVFVARVRSEDGQSAAKELSLTVSSAAAAEEVAIDTPRLPPAMTGGAYNVSLEASGGDEVFTWSLAGGSLPPGLQLGPGGSFSGAPSAAGTFTFGVRVSSAGRSVEKSFTITVVAHDGSRFDITPFEVAPVPAEIRPHLAAAIERWERVITGNLGAVQIPKAFFSSTFCGGFGGLVNGTSVDDLIVMMDISPIDGVGKILGQAGPCGLRSATPLPFVGVLTLDSEDLQPMVGTQTLTDIIFHEIGHILGFGGLWESGELIVGGGTADPRFTGTRAAQEWAALGGSGNVPLESGGGAGTKDTHWRETVFRTEIMTGFAERVGVSMPLSRVTIASLADLGYTVNLGAADAYALPTPAAAPSVVPRPSLGYDVVLDGPVKVLPESAPPR